MIWGLLGALGAAVCYGGASILQALAARQERTAEGLDPRLLLRLVKSWRYLLGLALDGFAFVLSIVLPGPQVVVYLLLWILIPSEK